jgi:hypothetical protein
MVGTGRTRVCVHACRSEPALGCTMREAEMEKFTCFTCLHAPSSTNTNFTCLTWLRCWVLKCELLSVVHRVAGFMLETVSYLMLLVNSEVYMR